ncbi:ammonia channel protein [Candidatus Bathyarchaeota archaeon RBG_13_38_9]|nr:MAG: ammonia channel protein [Candidatus Bathyarchaeota archaeon RBG_13_38_9]
MDSGDISWILISSALVMLMTPGLAFFYGGLVRRKNVLSIVMQSFIAMAVVGVIWVLWGYSLAFGSDIMGIIGGLEWFALNDVGLEPAPLAPTIPHLAFMVYQGMFAIITPALITGAFADRMRFRSYLFFIVLWSTFVYSPIAHWVWGGGWLSSLGALDFAGGTVVHISAGMAALMTVFILGKRKGYGEYSMTPHNIPLIVLGTALLWFGWFGFNAGSALGANETAVLAFVTTNTAAATGTLPWLMIDWSHKGTPSLIGAATGAVAGLVAITPAAGFVTVQAALAIGFGASIICYAAIQLKNRFHLDDALDVWGVHGVGGIWGAIATGIFATGVGLIAGNLTQLSVQVVSVIATMTYSVVATWLILKAIDSIMGLRVSPEEEAIGLDISLHLEEAYAR